jgi:hypothetical protein
MKFALPSPQKILLYPGIFLKLLLLILAQIALCLIPMEDTETLDSSLDFGFTTPRNNDII